MKRVNPRVPALAVALVVVAALAAPPVWAQEPTLSELFRPDVFRQLVDLQSSLGTINRALTNPEELDRLGQRILVLDGVAASLMVYADSEDEFYAEIELVSGAWRGVEEVEMYRAYLVLDDPIFSGRVLERAPRDPGPDLILRGRRLLVAAELVDVHIDSDGTPVPVLVAFEVRPLP